MNLRAKLILSIGALLVFLALTMYFLPYYLVEKDVKKAAQELKELVQKDEIDLAKSQKHLLEKQLEDIEANLDALLYLVNDTDSLRTAFGKDAFSKAAVTLNALSRFLAYDPGIGFVQLSNPKENKTLVIISNQTPFYAYSSYPLVEDVYLISINNRFYIGLHINPQKKGFLFFDIKEFWEKSVKDSEFSLAKKLKDARSQLQRVLNLNESASSQELEDSLQKFVLSLNKSHFKADAVLADRQILSPYFKKELLERTQWAVSVEMIQALAPFYGEGIEDTHLPLVAGYAQENVLGQSLAILSKDVFQQTPFFDDVKYYKEHSINNEPIADSRTLVKDPKSGMFYLTNTLFIDKDAGTFFSIGSQLYSFVRALALSSDRSVIMLADNQINFGFNDQGEEISKDNLDLIKKHWEELKTNPQMTFLGHSYRLYEISLEPQWDLKFLLFLSKEREKQFEGTVLRLNQAITNRISFHLLMVALGSLILALLILGRISLNVTKPITKLAKATEHVASGKYDEVELPVIQGKDEIAILTDSFREMVKGLRDRERIRGVLNKVVSKEVADEILKTNIHLGGEDRIVTMLFSDIRSFTKLTENLPPQEVIDMLNSYMTKMSHVIEGEGGCIDKFVGDEIMALYGAPVSHPDHAVRAVATGILMIERLKKWNKDRALQNLPAVEMGIGIHTGLVVAGNMGAEDRLNYTVLGSSVNLAARVCAAAKPMQILITESTYNESNVKDFFRIEELSPISLKGFSEPIKIFQVNGFEWQ